jgi:geranylgeranyl transferase type-2 subunit beta
MLSYLEDLILRLASGAARLPPAVRDRHARYLRSAQQADGGFTGRDGDSDLYYTSFALRSLAILGELHGPLAERSARFLQSRRSATASIDRISLQFGAALLEATGEAQVFGETESDWQESLACTFGQLRRDDGGYAKTLTGAASSTYSTFLVLLCHQLLEIPVEQPEQLIEFLLKQRGEDGGFREIRVAKRSGVNPTAAAVGALRILDGLTEGIRDGAVAFLCQLQNEEGGMRANTRIPIADLLSTFTSALTLIDLQALPEIDAAAAMRYAESLECADGGFQGAAWDEERDVEYTFYGLGCLALLNG